MRMISEHRLVHVNVHSATIIPGMICTEVVHRQHAKVVR